MPFMFILVLGIVLGFFVFMLGRAWMRSCENAQRAQIAREEAEAAEEAPAPKRRKRS